jgi:hypothetical protein
MGTFLTIKCLPDLKLTVDQMRTFLTSSPLPFCPRGRTEDLSAILTTIDAADQFVHVSVADYAPMRIFGEREYWPDIDDRLRMGEIF